MQKIESLVRVLGLEEVVDLCGRVYNPYPYLGAAACFAQASRYEGFGMAIVEALAAGAPVAATTVPTGPERYSTMVGSVCSRRWAMPTHLP